MKSLPIVLRFASGSSTPLERGEEFVRRVDVDERDVVMAAEQADHLLRLALAHEAVIDEDAGQLVADRLVDQHRRDRQIDAAREPADHPPVSPTLPRIRSISSARKAAIVQSPSRPATLCRKLAMSFAPSGVWTTSGWNMVV